MKTQYQVRSTWKCQGTNWGAKSYSRHYDYEAAVRAAIQLTAIGVACGADQPGHVVYAVTGDGDDIRRLAVVGGRRGGYDGPVEITLGGKTVSLPIAPNGPQSLRRAMRRDRLTWRSIANALTGRE